MRIACLASLLLGIAAASHPSAYAVPGEVNGLRWCAGAKDCLEWNVVGGPSQYTVYRGDRGASPA